METIMNLLDQYDFKDIYTQYKAYKDWQSEMLKQNTNDKRKAFKEARPAPDYFKPEFTKNELLNIDVMLATIKAEKHEDGSYSIDKTISKLGDIPAKWILAYLHILTSRSDYYKGSAKENTRHCTLVPIFLAAQKQYNGIMYEQWNKEDKYMNIALGNTLYNSITKWAAIPLSEQMRTIARRNALKNKQGKVLQPSAWAVHSVELDRTLKLVATDPFRHMWLQTWMANAENRNEYMILDVHDWDLMPEALDAVAAVQEYVPAYVPKEEDALPW